MIDEPILLTRDQWESLCKRANTAETKVKGLEEWIEQEGERGDICTYNILKKVCSYCQCKRKKEKSDE